MSQQGVAVGISLGSESATLAITPAAARDNQGHITTELLQLRPNLIAAEDGERSTPAYGAWVNGELLVGAPAKNAAIRHPQRSVGCLAPLLSKVEGFNNLVKAQVDYEDESGEAMLPTLQEEEDGDDGTVHVPHPVSEIVGALVNLMKNLAVDAAHGRGISSVVVSVPRYVDGATVLSMLDKVDFPTSASVQVISDDCAAALANGIGGPAWTPKLSHHGVLVVDCGATATTASVLSCEGGAFALKSSEYTTGISGKKIDKAIAKQLITNFKRKTRQDPGEEGRPYRKLLAAAERVKKTLSSSQTANAEVEAYYEGMDLMDQFSRGKLDTCLTTDCFFFPQLEGLVEKALTAADKEKTKISHIVLHGGIMRIPSVLNGAKSRLVEVVKKVCGAEGHDAIEVMDTVPGDEAAAVGAALQAALVSNGGEVSNSGQMAKGQVRRDATTFDLGFWCSEAAPEVGAAGELSSSNNDGAEFCLVIQKGSPLPMEVVLELGEESEERSLLPVARLEDGKYVALHGSANTNQKKVRLLLKSSGDLTISSVSEGESFTGKVESLLSANLF